MSQHGTSYVVKNLRCLIEASNLTATINGSGGGENYGHVRTYTRIFVHIWQILSGQKAQSQKKSMHMFIDDDL